MRNALVTTLFVYIFRYFEQFIRKMYILNFYVLNIKIINIFIYIILIGIFLGIQNILVWIVFGLGFLNTKILNPFGQLISFGQFGTNFRIGFGYFARPKFLECTETVFTLNPFFFCNFSYNLIFFKYLKPILQIILSFVYI